MPAVIGQDKIISVLKTAMKEGTVAHAYLFCGAEGSGKKRLALCFAGALTCHRFPSGPCGGCLSCRKAQAGVHPDISLVLPEGRSLRIEQVRQVKKTAYLRPHESRCQIFILDAAMITPEAANSLLKLLEEPPDGTVFLLLAENPSLLPPTVVSRCQQFVLERLAASELRRVLEEAGTPPENRELAIRLADGLPGRALAAAATNLDEQLAGALSFLGRMGNGAGAGRLAAELETKKDITVFLDLLLTVLRDMLVLTTTGQENFLVFLEHKSQLWELAAMWPAHRCRAALRELLGLLENLQNPVNTRLACEQALRSIH